jgi:hypothetical protein
LKPGSSIAAWELGMAPLSPAQRPLIEGCTHHWQKLAAASLFLLALEIVQ